MYREGKHLVSANISNFFGYYCREIFIHYLEYRNKDKFFLCGVDVL